MVLSSEPEVQGQVEPSNCIISQFPGKFILAHVLWHIFVKLLLKYDITTCIKSKNIVFINELK